MAKPDQRELQFLSDRFVEKVWQGNEEKRGLANQLAGVALAAIQDFTETLYMETADEFVGRELQREWLEQSGQLGE